MEWIPEDCGYDKKYPYQKNLRRNNLPYYSVQKIHALCKKRWGWYFQPTERSLGINDSADAYTYRPNVDCVITFESAEDMAVVLLSNVLNNN